MALRARGRRVRGADDGSSSPTRERSGGRKSAGSRIAGGKTTRSVAGSRKPELAAKAALLGTLVEERRFGPGKSCSLTGGRWKRFLVLRGFRIEVVRTAAECDRGRQRSSASSALGRQSRARVVPPNVAVPALPGVARLTGNVVCSMTEAGAAPSSACPTGAGLPLQGGGSAPLGRTRSRSGKNPAVVRSASCESGNRMIYGCSCRKSVAEVGKKHLVRVVEGSREANQEDAE